MFSSMILCLILTLIVLFRCTSLSLLFQRLQILLLSRVTSRCKMIFT